MALVVIGAANTSEKKYAASYDFVENEGKPAMGINVHHGLSIPACINLLESSSLKRVIFFDSFSSGTSISVGDKKIEIIPEWFNFEKYISVCEKDEWLVIVDFTGSYTKEEFYKSYGFVEDDRVRAVLSMGCSLIVSDWEKSENRMTTLIKDLLDKNVQPYWMRLDKNSMDMSLEWMLDYMSVDDMAWCEFIEKFHPFLGNPYALYKGSPQDRDILLQVHLIAWPMYAEFAQKSDDEIEHRVYNRLEPIAMKLPDKLLTGSPIDGKDLDSLKSIWLLINNNKLLKIK